MGPDQGMKALIDLPAVKLFSQSFLLCIFIRSFATLNFLRDWSVRADDAWVYREIFADGDIKCVN